MGVGGHHEGAGGALAGELRGGRPGEGQQGEQVHGPGVEQHWSGGPRVGPVMSVMWSVILCDVVTGQSSRVSQVPSHVSLQVII